MSAPVTETRHEALGVWLPITEYSVKSGMSLSTIRRKIKSNSIQFKIDKGRYLLLLAETPSVPTVASAPLTLPKSQTPKLELESLFLDKEEVEEAELNEIRFPAVDTAVKMVSTAFEHALKEKEERLKVLEKRNKELEDRLFELKMLVQMLEQKYRVKY